MTSAEGVYVSSSALLARTVREAVEQCARYGFPGLELSSSFPYYDGIREEVAAAGDQIPTLLHNYFPPPSEGFVINLASGDRDTRQRSIEHCRAALELSAEIGAPYYSVHAGFTVDPRPADLGRRITAPPSRDRHEALQVFYDSVSGLCECAEANGIGLLIENNVVSPRNLTNGRNRLLLGVSAADFHELFRAVPSPRLGMLLDVAHLKVSAQSLGFDRETTLAELRPYVRAVHVSDNDGSVDNNQPFDRGAWFVPHLGSFPGAAIVIETGPVDAAALTACVRIAEEAQ